MQMQPIVTDRAVWPVGPSICHDRETCKKMAELIEMLFVLWTQVHPRNHVLDEGPDPHMLRGQL